MKLSILGGLVFLPVLVLSSAFAAEAESLSITCKGHTIYSPYNSRRREEKVEYKIEGISPQKLIKDEKGRLSQTVLISVVYNGVVKAEREPIKLMVDPFTFGEKVWDYLRFKGAFNFTINFCSTSGMPHGFGTLETSGDFAPGPNAYCDFDETLRIKQELGLRCSE